MTTLEQAARQALEALDGEAGNIGFDGFYKRARDALRKALSQPEYPLPDSLYPGSKDWVGAPYHAKVEWLHDMYESKKKELDMYLEQALSQPEQRCNPHPDAPHGFDRDASHNEDRYVCECESWEPEQQEPVAFICQGHIYMDSDIDEYCTSPHIPLYTHPAREPELPPECKTEEEKRAYAFGWFKALEVNRKEWRGLSAHQINDAYIAAEKQAEDAFAVTRRQLVDAITEKLKRKNA